MKYKHGGRIALANINKDTLIHETKFGTSIMEDYSDFIPTPLSISFKNDIGLSFDENEFSGNIEFLGSGFFADVYRVRHITSNTLMAFKVPRATESTNKFLNEIQLMKRLDHKNILKFHGTCVVNGLFGCLTEYLDSGNLSCLIEQHGSSLEWPTVVRIARDISNGLSYLHQQSIVHRDLSSENILLHKKSDRYSINNSMIIRYRAVIADFGLFLNLKRKRSDLYSTVGNPFYTAPENLRNQLPYNFASDVFSFGMILCEIITGLKNDPDNIPRTDNYGLNYKELKVKKDCPKWLQGLACDCCMVFISNRPSMRRAYEIITENKKYINLWQSAPTSEESSFKFYNSMDGVKIRTMSMSNQRPINRERLKTMRAGGIEYNDINKTMLQVNGSTLDRMQERPLCRYNSVDSFIDPRLVNLHKASKDPGYVDRPLTTSMKQLDPRRKLSTNKYMLKKLHRSCSESDVLLRSTSINEQNDVDQWPERSVFDNNYIATSSPISPIYQAGIVVRNISWP